MSKSSRGDEQRESMEQKRREKRADGPLTKRSFRSVLDYETEEELRHALDYCSVSSVLGGAPGAAVAAAAAEAPCGVNKADWLLAVPDDEAEVQDLETEVQRLWTLKSYRALDEYELNGNDDDALLPIILSEAQRAQEREKCDALCREACQFYKVPVSAISLVDLGRQYDFSSCGLPPAMRSISRQVAFCAHAILSKHKGGITVVNDTLQDARFKNNILVTQSPHLRFYAGAPLQSPEGYNLGTFCVEGPEPKPEGLSRDQQAKLQEYAKRVVDLLVQRRRTLLDRLVSACKHASTYTDGSAPSLDQSLLRHAGVTTNLGGLLHYYQYSPDDNDNDDINYFAGGGSCVTAMHLLQESVQTLMLLQDDADDDADAKDATTTTTATATASSSSLPPSTAKNKPSKERLEEMLQLWTLLSAANNAKQSRKAFFQTFRRLFPPMDMTHTTTTTTNTSAAPNTIQQDTATVASTAPSATSSTIPSSSSAASTILLCPHHASIVGGIPGLFSRSSKLKGSMPMATESATRNTSNNQSSSSSILVFSEPFRISIGSERDQGMEPKFLVPLEQCSKATLFNMGLIHYHWGNPDTAMQLFDLASSLSQQLSPLAFDPVILGSFNNQAQILFQHYGRQSDAMEMLQDALTRGNAALATLYEREGIGDAASAPAHAGGWCARRLRRKLARTVMNMGHVHFVKCEYEAALATCHEALRLLHANLEDMEICAVWHNMGLIHYYKNNNQQGYLESYNNKVLALDYLNRFLDRAPAFIGNEHLQIAEALHVVGLIYFEGMGNLNQKSIQPLNEALRIRQSRLGPNHALVAESLCVMGRLLQAREEYDFSIGALTKGIAIFRGQVAQDCNSCSNNNKEKGPLDILSFDGARALLDLGRTFHAQGRLKDALKVYLEATEWSKHIFGQHVYVARLLILVGNLHLETSHVDLAMQCFNQATYIFIQQKMPVVWNLVKDLLSHVHLLHHPVAAMA